MSTEHADTFMKQLVGLMFRKPGTYRMIFDMGKDSSSSIHTWFCRMPITIQLLDVHGKQVEIYRAVPPWRLIIPRVPYRYIVETTGDLIVGGPR